MIDQLTYDPIYETVGDFPALLEVDRYGDRTEAFDGIISATHDHFWDPMDQAYINFDAPLDLKQEMIMPREMIIELNSAVADKLDEGQQIRIAKWSVARCHRSLGASGCAANVWRQTRFWAGAGTP